MTRLAKTVETKGDGRLIIYYDPSGSESDSQADACDDG